MEVGDEAVRDLELVRWMNELVRPSLVRLYNSAREHTRLEGADNAAANGVHVLLGLQRLVDNVGRILRDLEVLAVHAVLCEILNFNRFEDALTNVQLHGSDLDALLFSCLQELFREVESSCWRCNRSDLTWVCKHTLVCFLVGIRRFTLYVLRKRHLSDALDYFMQIAIVGETNCTTTGRGVIDDFAVEAIVVEVDLVSDANLASRLNQDIPNALLGLQLTEEHDLDLRIGLFLLTEQTGWEHLCVVHNDHITLVHVLQDVLELLVFDITRLAIENHHFGGFAWVSWILGDRVFRNRELELRELHGGGTSIKRKPQRYDDFRANASDFGVECGFTEVAQGDRNARLAAQALLLPSPTIAAIEAGFACSHGALQARDQGRAPRWA